MRVEIREVNGTPCRYCRNEDGGDCPRCYTPKPQGPISWTVGATFQSVHSVAPGWTMSVDDAGSIDVQRADATKTPLARDPRLPVDRAADALTDHLTGIEAWSAPPGTAFFGSGRDGPTRFDLPPTPPRRTLAGLVARLRDWWRA